MDFNDVNKRDKFILYSNVLPDIFHYKDDEEELIRRYDYTSRVVKESLASYFEYCYCQQNGINTASSIMNSWRKNPVWTYPYSGANNIYDIAKFKDIYKTSLVDMDSALRTLLYADDFYSIKNAIEIKNKYISKPTATITKDVPQVFVVKNVLHFSEESLYNYLYTPNNTNQK